MFHRTRLQERRDLLELLVGPALAAHVRYRPCGTRTKRLVSKPSSVSRFIRRVSSAGQISGERAMTQTYFRSSVATAVAWYSSSRNTIK